MKRLAVGFRWCSGVAKRRVFVFVQHRSDLWLVRRAARIATTFLKAFQNDDHNLHHNGEARYLERLPGDSITCAFDVGGFRGEWASELLTHQPGAFVHCFEIAPKTAEELTARLSGEDRVRVTPFGLGSIDGERVLFFDERSPDVTSLVRRPDADVTEVVGRVRQGDSYAREHGIERIDLLKIDTEGYDIEVLRGFTAMLTAGSISVIQFEYNQWNRVARVLLSDFYDMLEPLGYMIGKVRWHGVEFKPYTVDDETWVGPACVAVHRSRPDLVDAIT